MRRVAIYHLSVKPLSRGNGRSATAASAYRAAARVRDATTGEVFDYTRKRGVEHAEVMLPTAAASVGTAWARDREKLWNAAEIAERRRDARVAREYEVALPHELSARERLNLVRAFSGELADRYGCAVDFAIHAPHREGDVRNHHAHILATTRRLEPQGLGAKTTIELKDADRAALGLTPARQEITAIRARWAVLTNEALEQHGHAARVDHRSLEDQGIDREPSAHWGPAFTAMQRRGVRTELGWRLESEASARLARAVEQGALARETAGLDREIITVETSLSQALQLRDQLQQRGLTAEEIKAQGRERWLESRVTNEGAVLLDANLAKSKAASHARDDGLVLE